MDARIIGLATALAAAAVGPLPAQGRSAIIGIVLSHETTVALPGARVVITRPVEGDTTLLTDANGRFALRKIPGGRYWIQASWGEIRSPRMAVDLGERESFEAEFTVGGPTPVLADPAAQVLPDLATEADRGDREWRTFELRRREGLGQYLTRDQIEERNAGTLNDLLRNLRGIRIGCGRDGCIPYMQRAPAGCAPTFFLDESTVDARTAATTRASDIRGIEVYQGLAQVPGELARDHWQARCGVVVIWTRRGPGATPPPA